MSTSESTVLDDRDQLTAALAEHGSQRALASSLGVHHSSVKRAMDRHSITSAVPSSSPLSRGRRPTLTRGHVEFAMQPTNNCRVKSFRDSLDETSQDALDYALELREDLTAGNVRDMLIEAGFRDSEVPGVDAINSHRRGVKPCRCKG